MRKNGFTLIELLAVIVILAIIALIATPIILGIINDAREKANERSVELYASAVRNAIASYQLTNPNAPTSFEDLDVEYDGEVVCKTEELYADGSFYITGCKINNGEKEYSYGTKQGTGVEVGKISICNPLEVQTEGTYTPGDKYECDVDPNKKGYDQIFYVLNATTTEVNLIMDSNINISGEAVKGDNTSDYGLVSWINEDNYGALYPFDENRCYEEKGCLFNDKGPVTAMKYLQTATSEWTNTNKLTINKFNSCDDNGVCTDKAMTEYIVNARMPYYNELNAVGCNLNEESCPDWVANYLNDENGYWTLSSDGHINRFAWFVYYNSSSNVDEVNNDSRYGVRPVINLSI